jgi:CRISPR-associated protein Cmr2
MDKKPDRFVLSTHTVAVSTSLWRWAERKAAARIFDPEESKALSALREELDRLRDKSEEVRSMALPAKLHHRLWEICREEETVRFFKQLPSYLDAVDDERAREQAVRCFEKCFGTKPETYYGLVLMDGDQMGQWLSGGIDRPLLESRFHDSTLADIKSCGQLEAYLATQRPVSPAWHQAISTALNGFALHLSRVVVEELFMGKLIYAGGDDLLAMVAVHDLPQLMFALRCVFSGQIPADEDHTSFWKKLGTGSGRIRTGSGFALVKEGGEARLLRLMGAKATASVGAIIAHHQAPLGRVLSELRRAEGRAKTEGGRDAFCITVCKRSGGTSHLIGKWNLDHPWAEGDMGLLLDLRDVLARDVSRRAAYELTEVFRHIPSDEAALATVMDYQFRRKAKEEGTHASRLAEHLARRAVSEGRAGEHSRDGWPLPNLWLRNMVLTAEFLAREGRVAEDFHSEHGE